MYKQIRPVRSYSQKQGQNQCSKCQRNKQWQNTKKKLVKNKSYVKEEGAVS
jgi:hypothetical protein